MKKLIAALIAGLFATGVFAQASAPAADAAAAPAAAEKAAPKAKKAKKHHHKKAAKNGPARDADHHSGKAIEHKVKEKKEKWL